MIPVTAQTRIVVAVEPVDFRKGIDGLARVCKQVLEADPFLCGGQQYVTGGDRGARCFQNSGI
jgi:transposase